MGMFDEVKVHMALPDIGTVNWTFQTKALWRRLDQYEIQEDGKLYLIKEWGFDRLDSPQEVVDYHADIDLIEIRDDVTYEFVVRFTDGKVSRITRVRRGEGETDASTE